MFQVLRGTPDGTPDHSNPMHFIFTRKNSYQKKLTPDFGPESLLRVLVVPFLKAYQPVNLEQKKINSFKILKTSLKKNKKIFSKNSNFYRGLPCQILIFDL